MAAKTVETGKNARRYDVSNPGATAVSLATFLTTVKGIDVTPEQARAFLSFHSEWQRGRGAERDAIREAAKAERDRRDGEKLLASEAKLLEKLAKIEAAKAAS